MYTAEHLFRNFTSNEFEAQALELFRYQSVNNNIYKKFISLLGIDTNEVRKLKDIPFLPISFFKNFKVVTSAQEHEKVFTSSGTTGSQTSHHYITDISLYHKQLEKSFAYFYGDIKDYIIFPLLPAYAERTGSSLIEMVDNWMTLSGQPNKTYYLYDYKKLIQDLQQNPDNKKVILIGVSFALLDLAESFPIDLSDIIIMETGGMKGRKKEITRQELHQILQTAFKTDNIQSEYGMTELLSQAYAKENGLFQTPPWMKVMLRDPEDPLSYVIEGKSGGINVIDFANINSCSFIATDDLGRYHTDNQLEILGRFDNSDVRGCNLMVIE